MSDANPTSIEYAIPTPSTPWVWRTKSQAPKLHFTTDIYVVSHVQWKLLDPSGSNVNKKTNTNINSWSVYEILSP